MSERLKFIRKVFYMFLFLCFFPMIFFFFQSCAPVEDLTLSDVRCSNGLCKRCNSRTGCSSCSFPCSTGAGGGSSSVRSKPFASINLFDVP